MEQDSPLFAEAGDAVRLLVVCSAISEFGAQNRQFFSCRLWRLLVGLISKIVCEIELKTGDRISIR